MAGTFVQTWRVPLGFLTAAIFLVLARPTPITLAVGGIVALLGLALRAWAAGHIRKNVSLAITGPYALTRNPLYLGSFLLGLGFTIASGRWVLALVFAALFIGIYLPVMRVEASDLARAFGDEYRRYSESVPLFLPRLTQYDAGAHGKFDRALYFKHREYQAALGVILGWLALAIKSYYIK